jgi:hypothetical protein
MSQQPSSEELTRWHRWFAVESNNRAWQLADQAARSPAEDDEMLNSAHAAALHWAAVGTPLNEARARLLLGHVHASLGHGHLAVRYARASHTYLVGVDSSDWEIAFSHAVMAHAAAAAGDAAVHRESYGAARASGDSIADPQDRAIFEATFAHIPPP